MTSIFEQAPAHSSVADDEPGTAPHTAEPVQAVSVTPAIGPLPPLLVRARPRRQRH